MNTDSSNLLLLDRQLALARIGGDKELLGELAQAFLEEYPVLLSSVREGLAEGEAKEAANAAHQLKGLLGQFGAEPARLVAARLEQTCKAGNLVEAESEFAALQTSMQQLYPLLRALSEPD